MTTQKNILTQLPQYRWPDLSSVTRQYIVRDDQGRLGIAHQDHRQDVLFAHPIDYQAIIVSNHAQYMTATPWHLQDDGSYTGTWFDYDGPTFPATIPPGMIRRITIMQDLGYLMPDKWADKALAGSDKSGHWDYGATLGKVGGSTPVKGQKTDEMTVGQAEEYAREVGEQASARGIRLAAKNGYIPGARKVGRDWLITYEGFNYYLDNRPKPGRKQSQ